MWQLEPDTIYTSHALPLLRKMEDNSVDAIITDPPYDFTGGEKVDFQNEFRRVSKGWVIVFCPPENLWRAKADQTLFWIKPISTKNTSKRYSRFVEVIQVFGTGTWNAGRHWSQYTNVFTDLVDEKSLHPFRKPPSLIKRLMLNHTNPGDLILDPFTGSAVVPMVAVENGRHFIACDITDEHLPPKARQYVRYPR